MFQTLRAAIVTITAVLLVAQSVNAAGGSSYLDLMKGLQVPGAVVLVVDHGRIIEERSFGIKNVDTQDPVGVHTRFEIGSITKQFTAAAILQLKGAGKLSLDDKLGKYIPEYVRGRDVTLRQMLWQISGIPSYTDGKAFSDLIVHRRGRAVLSRSGSLASVIGMIKDHALDFSPGAKWEYSNSNYYFLGRVVEVASGQPWSAYIATHVFKPAGMTESSFMENEVNISDMATGYGISKSKHALIATGTFSGWAGGAGAIVSTASDLAKWDAALFAGTIISKADLAIMLKPSALSAGGTDVHYAFGWVLDRYEHQPRVWHNGGTLGFTASNQIYPEQKQTVIVLANFNSGADELANATFDRLHPDFAAASDKPVPGEDVAVTDRAKAVWDSFVFGKPDRAEFTDEFNKEVTDEVLAGVKAQLAPLGEPALIFKGKTAKNGTTLYTYRLLFKNGRRLMLYIGITSAGKIADYAFGAG
jgi:D-alanyl-D-alanine carboxypeptidase